MQVVRMNLTSSAAVSTDAGGNLVFSRSPTDVNTSTEWTTVSGLFQDYRVLAIECEWQPFYNNTYSTLLSHGAGAAAVDHSGVITPGTIDTVNQYQNFKVFHSGRPLKIQWRAAGFEELQWTPVSSASNFGSVFGFIPGLTGSVAYGRVFTRFLVELRGRK